MGWWSSDLLGGDDPLDTLGFFSDRIGVDLYPLELDSAQAALVRERVEAIDPRDIITDCSAGEIPVIAAVYLHVGADICSLRECFLHAIQNDYFADGWNDGGVERRKIMTDFEAIVRNHKPGDRVDIQHRGLIETMMTAVQTKT